MAFFEASFFLSFSVHIQSKSSPSDFESSVGQTDGDESAENGVVKNNRVGRHLGHFRGPIRPRGL